MAEASESLALQVPMPLKLWQYQCDHEEIAGDIGLPILLPASRLRVPVHSAEDRPSLDELLYEEVHTGTLAWIEATWYQSLVGMVILANAVFIGLETDSNSSIWVPVEHSVLIFFTVELGLRLARYRLGFFGSAGNIFDFVVFCSGAVDMWVVPIVELFKGGERNKKSSFLQVMQMLRLLRIVRLIRLVKMIGPLYSLALGIAEAMQGMFWVLIFLFMMLYTTAIFTTRMIGPGSDLLFEGEAAQDSDIVENREMFTTVGSSMFVLFESMSCWSLMQFVPIFRLYPVIRLLAVFFYIFANWCLLAVMTGVVSEKMLATREKMRQEETGTGNLEIAGEALAQALAELFSKADSDGSGSISREEFPEMLLCTEIMKPMMEQSVLDIQDMALLFDWLDRDKDNSVTIEEFILGLTWIHAQIDPKSLLKLEEELGSAIRETRKRLIAVVDKRFDILLGDASQPLRKIAAVAEQIQRLDGLIDLAKRSTEEEMDKIACRQLDAVERRLTQQLVSLREAVAKLDELEASGVIEFAEEEYVEEELIASAAEPPKMRKDSSFPPEGIVRTPGFSV